MTLGRKVPHILDIKNLLNKGNNKSNIELDLPISNINHYSTENLNNASIPGHDNNSKKGKIFGKSDFRARIALKEKIK